MLILVKKYGLSHVCALQEFKAIGGNAVWNAVMLMPYNFPFLDIYLSNTSVRIQSEPSEPPEPQSEPNSIIEFYYRGTKDQNLTFKNLFEYLFSTADGQG